MRSSERLIMIVGLAALGTVACARAGTRSDVATGVDAVSASHLAQVRSDLEATFAARHRAYEAKDFATLVNQISPDYLAVRPDGSRMTRADLANYIRRNLDRWVRITSWSNRIENLRLQRNKAVADMRQRVARIQIVDGREALVESAVLQTETWVSTPAGWKLLAVRNEREMTLTIDGRPVG